MLLSLCLFKYDDELYLSFNYYIFPSHQFKAERHWESDVTSSDSVTAVCPSALRNRVSALNRFRLLSHICVRISCSCSLFDDHHRNKSDTGTWNEHRRFIASRVDTSLWPPTSTWSLALRPFYVLPSRVTMSVRLTAQLIFPFILWVELRRRCGTFFLPVTTQTRGLPASCNI